MDPTHRRTLATFAQAVADGRHPDTLDGLRALAATTADPRAGADPDANRTIVNALARVLLRLEHTATDRCDDADYLRALGVVAARMLEAPAPAAASQRYTVRPRGGTAWATAATLDEARRLARDASDRGLVGVVIVDERTAAVVPPAPGGAS